MEDVSSTAFNWQTIVGFITILILLLTLWFSLHQVRAARRSTHAQLVVGMYEHLRNKVTVETLQLIYRTKPEDIGGLSDTEIEQIERVLDRLDVIGHLLYKGLLDEYLAVEAFAGPPAIRCWHQLEQFIKRNRVTRGGRWCMGVEYLAKSTVKYQIEHTPAEHWIIYYPEIPGVDGINLVETELAEPKLLSKWELRFSKLQRRRRSIYRRQLKVQEPHVH